MSFARTTGMLLWVFTCAASAQQVSQQMTVGQNQSVIAAIMQPVEGSPYQAEEVVRSVQKLYDGTVITHEIQSTIARDSDGRVRQDMFVVHSAELDGRQVNRTFQAASVGDPVSHSMLFWTGETVKTAMRMQLPSLPKRGVGVLLAVPPPPPPKMLKQDAAPSSVARPVVELGQNQNVRTEELGQQSIEGVLAVGKRTTTTIPTGTIGNDRPITVVHEEWRSPELKILVKSIDSDPRTGEQTMELHNIVRTPPDPSLFQAPSGYKVQDIGDALKSLGQIGRSSAGQQ